MSLDVKFKVLERTDFDQVFEFLQTIFRVQEPITDALKTTANDSYIFYKDLCSAGFQRAGTSLSVVDENGELVGIALNGVYSYNDLPRVLGTQKSDFTKEIANGPYPTPNANRLIVFIEHVEAGLFGYLKATDRIFKCDILCVRKDYCGQGIGSKLISKSVKLAKQFGCTVCATTATAQASQRLFKKHGFQTLRRVEFAQFFDNNEAVYLGVHDNGKSAKCMLLDLQKHE
ncbi:Acetyltransferase, GNAT family [Aphelenchoides bicaudatus]|nr:Acetyltransferase, GNAT family [Aphelenchoides bicaudatus]